MTLYGDSIELFETFQYFFFRDSMLIAVVSGELFA